MDAVSVMMASVSVISVGGSTVTVVVEVGPREVLAGKRERSCCWKAIVMG